MKILFVSRSLYPVGGVETYVLQLGEYLEYLGHQVQYFGEESENQTVGNNLNLYVNNNSGVKIFNQYYSFDAKRKIKKLLNNFKPDVIHLNNFHYGVTPVILPVIDKWRKENHRKCKVVYTAHDFHLVCPTHLCYNVKTGKLCEKCLKGHFHYPVVTNCMNAKLRYRIFHSFWMWYWSKCRKVFRLIDDIVCCSQFIKTKYDRNNDLKGKTLPLHNYITAKKNYKDEIGNYVLYFGRYKQEKGITTLLKAAESLPQIPFVFAGTGPMAEEIVKVNNAKDVGFKGGEELIYLIQNARFSVISSEWYENCPFSVIESQMFGTPVLGADIGGIPELISLGKTGELFKSGDAEDLTEKIEKLWNNTDLIKEYKENCKNVSFDTIETYCKKLIDIYKS